MVWSAEQFIIAFVACRQILRRNVDRVAVRAGQIVHTRGWNGWILFIGRWLARTSLWSPIRRLRGLVPRVVGRDCIQHRFGISVDLFDNAAAYPFSFLGHLGQYVVGHIAPF